LTRAPSFVILNSCKRKNISGGKMDRKRIPAIVLCLVLAVVCVSPSGALLVSDAEKAKDYINAGMIPQAVELLNKRINEKPSDVEAHFILGICFLKLGNGESAEETFERAVSLKPDYREKVGTEFKKAADTAFKNGRLPKAGYLFETAMKYNPGIEKKAYQFYVKLGDAADNLSAITYYNKALSRTNGKDQQHQIGYRFLKIAINLPPGPQYKRLKNRAIVLLGREKLDEVLPRSFKKIIFERTYSYADIDPERGDIVAFIWSDKFKKGDLVEISGYIPEDVDEISIFLGKNFDPEWKTTDNGDLSYSIEDVPPAGSYYLVRIGEDVEFTLKVSRKINPRPDEDLLNSFIK
jgi:tetratricopeptide (TPR) repeat protein